MVDLAALTAEDWDAAEDAIVVLPVGSTEQHGPHLPLGTDTLIAVGICEAASRHSNRIICAPAIPFGVSDHHKRLPGGAISAGPQPFADYLEAVIVDLLEAASRPRVAVVNGHGGNWPAITFVLDRLGASRGALPVIACSWWHFVGDLLLQADPAVAEGQVGHAGCVETSLMLALHSDRVKADVIPTTPAVQVGSDGTTRASDRPAVGYLWRDFATTYPTGVIGTPHTADVVFGEELIEQAARRLAAWVEAAA